MKTPVKDSLSFDVILSEAGIREEYLSKLYLPDVTAQISDGIFSKMIELIYLKKGFGYGKGRSGAAARDYVNRMKSRAKYTGRELNGEIRPMCYFLSDLNVTKFPPESSYGLLISGTGKKESVVEKALGCLNINIDTIGFSYEPRSAVSKLCAIYHHIPKKFSNSRGTLDTMGNSFETAANISANGLVEGLVKYHAIKDLDKASDTSLKFINAVIDYVHHLGRSLGGLK
jgi:D-arabinose 5-phosphate isomerase GutQ